MTPAIYQKLLRPLLFRIDPERAHQTTIQFAARMGWAADYLRAMLAVSDPLLETSVAGLKFSNPLGLSAGLDKSGHAIRALSGLGFGFVEIGSISAFPSPGNSRPRLFRLPDDRAILVSYGVPNDGAEAVGKRVDDVPLPVPLGINIVKTNHGPGAPVEPDDAIISEYMQAARRLSPRADYLMFNLSCPNTVDGKDFFADRARLSAWLDAVGSLSLQCPVFLKVSPLGGTANIDQLLEVVEPHAFVNGFMFNLPIVKPERYIKSPVSMWQNVPGAVSGPPSAPLLDTCLRDCYKRMDRKRYRLFASGGISTGADAYAKLRMGASLVSLYTALVFDGPFIVNKILRELCDLLTRDGVGNVAEIVGADNP
jgi:dihydroorotate dehydrogenase (fumarate)/dihydroorotate dehydrogenase